MKLNFCTLFNINYFAKGVALHGSLLKNCPDFNLYIFAFDDISYEILNEKNLPNTTIVSLKQFENESLLSVKKERNVAEYCWTCTPFTIKYCIENFNLDNCTYIDADTFFYEDPSILIKEMGDNSVLITPHNYHPKYDQRAVSGIYCVQFTTFKNNNAGTKVLNWWAQACLKWCYARYEDGKMGDQMYLDSWPYMFDGVHICRNIGGGLAPWNILNYSIKPENSRITVNGTPLIFYHFHDLKYLSDDTWFLGGYDIDVLVRDNIYKPYINALLEIDKSVKAQSNGADTLNTVNTKDLNALNLKFKFGTYFLDIKKSFNQFSKDLFFADRRRHYKSNYIKIN
jgi:hypothetical protein